MNLDRIVFMTVGAHCEECGRPIHPDDAVTVIRASGWVDTYCGDCAPIEEDDS